MTDQSNPNEVPQICAELYGGPADGIVLHIPSDWTKLYVPHLGTRHVYELQGYPEQFKYVGPDTDTDPGPGGSKVKAPDRSPRRPGPPQAKLMDRKSWENAVFEDRVSALLLAIHETSLQGQLIPPEWAEELRELQGFCPDVE